MKELMVQNTIPIVTMRTLFISTLKPGLESGGARRSLQLLDSFTRLGEVDVIHYSREGGCFNGLGRRFRIIPCLKPWPFSVQKYHSRALERFIKSVQRDYDVVFIDHSHLLYLLKGLKVQSCADFQNLEDKLLCERASYTGNPLYYLEAELFSRFVRKYAQYAGVIFSPSCKDRTLLAQWHSSVVFLPHSYSFPVSPMRRGERELLIFGNFDFFATRHGAEKWVKIFQAQVELRLWPGMRIIGNESVKYFTKSERMMVHGFMDQLEHYIGFDDIMVIPVEFGSGSRVKIMDSLAAGLPFASTEKGVEGWPEEIRGCGEIAENIDQLPEAVDRLLDQSCYLRRREKILLLREKYHSDAVFREYFKPELLAVENRAERNCTV
ncbi:MAG: glycosyltransferase [Candidatus Wallbacteria bacterium]|nr:glycosyltransferase [Candidatus Wallbacteria bacterium]